MYVSAFKLPAIWDVTPYSLVEVYWYFRGSYCLPPLWGLAGGWSCLIMQAAISSETLSHLYQYKCLDVPEGSSIASDFKYIYGCTFVGNSSYTSLQLVN